RRGGSESFLFSRDGNAVPAEDDRREENDSGPRGNRPAADGRRRRAKPAVQDTEEEKVWEAESPGDGSDARAGCAGNQGSDSRRADHDADQEQLAVADECGERVRPTAREAQDKLHETRPEPAHDAE